MAIALWRLVLAVFFVSVVAAAPLQLVVWAATGETLAAMPSDGLPAGELALVLIECLKPVWAPLLLALVTARLGLWAWTVLWHAGVVRWFVYSGRRDVRLAELLSRGLMGWWRWARLGLTAVAAVVLGVVVLVAGHGLLEERASAAALYGAVGLGLVWFILCRLATLYGAWALGEANRRSAVLAWVAGLRAAVTRPIRSLLTLAAWAVPGIAAAIMPLAVGWQFEVLRGPVAGTLIGLAAGLVAAFCWVALFLSFAPMTGRSRTESD